MHSHTKTKIILVLSLVLFVCMLGMLWRRFWPKGGFMALSIDPAILDNQTLTQYLANRVGREELEARLAEATRPWFPVTGPDGNLSTSEVESIIRAEVADYFKHGGTTTGGSGTGTGGTTTGGTGTGGTGSGGTGSGGTGTGGTGTGSGGTTNPTPVPSTEILVGTTSYTTASALPVTQPTLLAVASDNLTGNEGELYLKSPLVFERLSLEDFDPEELTSGTVPTQATSWLNGVDTYNTAQAMTVTQAALIWVANDERVGLIDTLYYKTTATFRRVNFYDVEVIDLAPGTVPTAATGLFNTVATYNAAQAMTVTADQGVVIYVTADEQTGNGGSLYFKTQNSFQRFSFNIPQ